MPSEPETQAAETSADIVVVRRTLPVKNERGDQVFYAKWSQDDGRVSAWVTHPRDADFMSREQAQLVVNLYTREHKLTDARMEIIPAPVDDRPGDAKPSPEVKPDDTPGERDNDSQR